MHCEEQMEWMAIRAKVLEHDLDSVFRIIRKQLEHIMLQHRVRQKGCLLLVKTYLGIILRCFTRFVREAHPYTSIERLFFLFDLVDIALLLLDFRIFGHVYREDLLARDLQEPVCRKMTTHLLDPRSCQSSQCPLQSRELV